MGARRYILNSVLEAIEERPIFSSSKELKESVNRKVKLKGWNKNIGSVRIGKAARLLESERAIVARRRPGKDRIKEYLSIHDFKVLNNNTNV